MGRPPRTPPGGSPKALGVRLGLGLGLDIEYIHFHRRKTSTHNGVWVSCG